MNSSSILLLVERNELVHRGLSKAVVLARHVGARLELLLCNAASYLTIAPGNAQAPARAARAVEDEEFLQALRHSTASADVQIECESISAPSLSEALTQKLRRSPAQIIVMPVGAGRGLPGYVAWHLATRCAVPLLLTDGRPWRASPRFAAAVDLGDRGEALLCGQIVALCERLAHSCSAQLDYLYANADRGGGINASAARGRLEALRRDCDVRDGELQYWTAEPGEILPRVIVRRDYDLLALGVRRDVCQSGWNKEVHQLTAGLLTAAAGDVLLIGSTTEADGQVGLDPARPLAQPPTMRSS